MYKIMVVEDEAIISMQLAQRIKAMGFEVVGVASSGEKAVDMAKNLKPDVILMDIVMPGRLDGIEAAAKIHEAQNIPIIFVTAYGEDSYVERAKSVGPYGYLIKPFQEKELKAAIEIAIYKKETEQRLRKSEQMYRSVVDSANDAIITLDSRGNVVSFNLAAEKIFGYSTKEAEGKPYFSMLTEQSRNILKSEIDKLVKPGEVEIKRPVEYIGLKSDGREFPIDISLNKWTTNEDIFITITAHDITESKQAWEAVKLASSELLQIFQTAADGMWVVDKNFNILRINETFSKIFMAHKNDVVGKKCYDVNPINLCHTPACILKSTLDSEKRVECEIEHASSEGKKIYCIAAATPFRNPDGELIGIVGSFKDITERKKEMEALQKSEKRFRELTEALPEIICETDLRGDITFVNRVAFKTFGYTREDFDTGLNVLQMLATEERERAKENIARVLKGEKMGRGEYTAQRKDGSKFPVLIHTHRISDNRGMPVGMRGILVDMTESKQVWDAVKLASSELAQIFQTAADGMCVIDKNFNVLRINETLAKIYSVRQNDTVGKKCFDVFQYTACKSAKCVLNGILDGKKRVECEVVKERNNGKNITCILTATPFRGHNGDLIGIVEHVKDITDRKGMEEALRRSEERFRQVAENAQDWIWEVDANGLYTYASPGVTKILGYKPEEVVGKKHFYDLFHPENREEIKKEAFNVFTDKQSFREFLNRNIHKNGKVVWLSTSGVPIIDENNNLIGYRGADTDITERRC